MPRDPPRPDLVEPDRFVVSRLPLENGPGCRTVFRIMREYLDSLTFAESLSNLDRHIIAAEGSAEGSAAYHFACLSGHFAGDSDALGTRLFGVVGSFHAFHIVVRHRHTQLVDHELRIAVTGQGPDAGDDRQFVLFDPAQEQLEQIEIENRLRDDIFGARFHLPGKPPELLVHVERARVGSDTNQQRSLGSGGITADIESLIEIVGDVCQADGIDIEDRARIRVGAHARRIPGDADEIADTGRVCAEQLGLDAEDVAIAAAEVENRLDTGMLLDELTGDLRTQAGTRARAIRHVDAVDAMLFA